MEQNLSKMICFTDRQEELTEEVTAAFERGSCFIEYSAAINVSNHSRQAFDTGEQSLCFSSRPHNFFTVRLTWHALQS